VNNSAHIAQTLATHPFLEGLSQPHLDKLVSLASEVRFQADQVIFREADPSSLFYLIVEGEVALEIRAPGRIVRVQTIGAGEELGWSSLLAKVNKQFQARTLSPVRAIAFDGVRLAAACDEDCLFGLIMLRKILAVVAERLRNTRLQVLDIYAKGGTSEA
jgi:CRP-like cAMP-binding protein